MCLQQHSCTKTACEDAPAPVLQAVGGKLQGGRGFPRPFGGLREPLTIHCQRIELSAHQEGFAATATDRERPVLAFPPRTVLVPGVASFPTDASSEKVLWTIPFFIAKIPASVLLGVPHQLFGAAAAFGPERRRHSPGLCRSVRLGDENGSAFRKRDSALSLTAQRAAP